MLIVLSQIISLLVLRLGCEVGPRPIIPLDRGRVSECR